MGKNPLPIPSLWGSLAAMLAKKVDGLAYVAPVKLKMA
jgi:hypothetical protein